MMWTSPVVSHVVVGGLCLVGGFLLGRVERALQRGQPARQRWAALLRLSMAVLLVGMAVFTVVARDQRTTCYEDYYTQVSRSLAERSAAQGAESAAQRELLLASRDDDDSRAALDRYIAALDRLELARQTAPIPQPPECR